MHLLRPTQWRAAPTREVVMRYLSGFVCVLTLGVMGCGEAPYVVSDLCCGQGDPGPDDIRFDGGTAGAGGSGGSGGDLGTGGSVGTGGTAGHGAGGSTGSGGISGTGGDVGTGGSGGVTGTGGVGGTGGMTGTAGSGGDGGAGGEGGAGGTAGPGGDVGAGGACGDGKANICAELTKVVVSPLQTSVGNVINLMAEAEDAEDDPVEYEWTALVGAIADPNDAVTIYTCAAEGEDEITITVSDYGGECCTSDWTVAVTCVGDVGAFEVQP